MAVTQGSGGTHIAYEVEGQGLPLVLLHGGATDLTSWKHAGYIQALSPRFRLVSIDARGAGRSDKPTDPRAHMMAAYVDDVIAVLRDLNIDDFVCWGYSMGGQTALSLAVTHPDRLKALVVTGAEIDPWSPREEYEEMLAAIEAEGMEVVASDFDTPEDPLPDWYRRLSLETDAEAFAASVGARLEWPGVTQDVEKIKMPTLFMGGEYENDPGELESMAQQVPRGVAEKVEGVGHIGVFARSDLVLPRLTSFLDRSLS